MKKASWLARGMFLHIVASYLPATAVGISTFPRFGGCCSFKGPIPPLLQISANRLYLNVNMASIANHRLMSNDLFDYLAKLILRNKLRHNHYSQDTNVNTFGTSIIPISLGVQAYPGYCNRHPHKPLRQSHRC